MKVELGFLRSQVARRILVLFVLSAFVPVLVFGVTALFQVQSVAKGGARSLLKRAGEGYGMRVYERLLNAQFVARQIAAHDGDHADDPEARRMFSAVGVLDDGKLVRGSLPPWLIAEARGRAADIQTEEPPVVVSPAADQVAMIARVPSGARLIVFQFDRQYIWGDHADLPAPVDICVFGDQWRKLYCSQPASEEFARTVAAGRFNDAAQTEQGRQSMAEAWPLFMRAHFHAADWTMVAVQPADVVGESTGQLVSLFVRIALLTVLLVGLLSVNQIRRTLDPLERLIAATRRLRSGRFDEPVVVRREDEFGQLAESFNDMAQRLGRQIAGMRALAEIDREMLAHFDIARIVERVQGRLIELVPDAMVGVIVTDPDSGGSGTLYLRRNAAENAAALRVPLVPEQVAALADAQGISDFSAASPNLPSFAELLIQLGGARCLALSARLRGEVRAIVVLGLAADRAVDEEVLRHLRELADRVVVAIAASEREQQLVHQAHHDALTGLPNRMLVHDRLRLEIAHARRNDSQIALLFIDLDRFKDVNDAYGHAAGDELLKVVSERLRACVRESDTVARLGGDEFVVVLIGVQGVRDAATVAEQIIRLLSQPFVLQGVEAVVSSSIGISLFPADGATSEQMLKHADIAMYRAKAGGRGRFVFFEERMNEEVLERAELERELRHAVARGQLRLMFQPRVRLSDASVCGAEALLRWDHPELGSISPARFIPLAEETGLIENIGQWVLDAACVQVRQWHEAGLSIGSVSVNVSARQLRGGDWAQRVLQAFARARIDSGSIEVEVTESGLFEDLDQAVATLASVREMGVRVALDDFGTGYSSIAYLRRLPLDIMKVDRSFVQDIAHDQSARNIAHAIIAMAHTLGKRVVAEGVESEEQAALLRGWGCDEAQGYLYGRPMSVEDFTACLKAQPAQGSAVA